MHVRFGRHLDGLQPWPPETAVGAVTLGPEGLLAVLETQLGLAPPTTHPGEAAFGCLQCLREAATPQRFFRRSLQVDPVGVARTLLAWREQWYEAGWDGTFPDDAPARLADMAAVEALAEHRIPPSAGERLARVAGALGARGTQIERVELHTPMDELPQAWRRVVAALPWSPAPGLGLAPAARARSDLARVQARLLAETTAGNGGRVATRERLRGDGSLLVVRAASRDLSADAVAEFLVASGESARTLLVAEQDGIILDNALERAGLARCGFRYHTPFRAATQVLKLCLALLWRPVSPHRVLQFLLHPAGPLPRWVRSRLAEAVAAAPGIGGPAWTDALRGIEQAQRERHEADDAAVEGLRAEVAYWLECSRHDPRAGAPLDALAARARRVSRWAGVQLDATRDTAEAALFGEARAQAQALLAVLARLRDAGVETMARLELERLVDEVTSAAPDPSSFGEAAHARATTSAATVTEPWPTVVWWNLAPAPPEVSYPWSRRELAALREAGVQLPEVDERLRQRGRAWLRPVLGATERLVLAVHDDERGRHPVWTQIESLFEGIAPVRIEQALLSGAASLAPLPVPTRALALRPLPAPRRWWNLPPDCPPARRAVESYSSLSKLCDYPHGWVLHYAARLRAGRASDLADGPLLSGSLGHRLIEEFFRAGTDWRSMPREAVLEWVHATLPGIIEREGAVLLEPGRGVERQRLGATLERALLRLIEHLRAAGAREVAPEVRAEIPFRAGRLTGAIDLLLTDDAGRHAVVDVKWGGQKHRLEQLATNRALQLATYAYLQKTLDASGRWPPGAFFILRTGHLLASEASSFPGALVSASEDGEGTAELWRRFGVTCDWRWRQLEAGRIEVVTEGTEPDEDSTPPEGGLAPPDGGDPFDDFVSLTGWEPFQ